MTSERDYLQGMQRHAAQHNLVNILARAYVQLIRLKLVPMITEDLTKEALQPEISKLKRRVEELSSENDALRKLCLANGVEYEEMLAAQRHRQYFARLRADHPIEEEASASDALCTLSIGQQIVLFSNNLLGFALASRNIYDLSLIHI